MNCTSCGAELMNGVQNCHNCGAPVQSSNYNYDQQGYQQGLPPQFQPMDGQPNFNQQQVNIDYSDLNIILKIVCLLLPLVGIILYFVWKNSAPVKAKSSITFAGIGFIINIIFAFL